MLQALNITTFAYFIAIDVIYVSMALVGWHAVDTHVRRRPIRDYDRVARSPLSPPITILVPAFNEQATIASSVRALLQCRYAALEVMVINDGSADGTLTTLIEEFDLAPADRVPRSSLTSQPVRALYRSRADQRLTVIDKENGGKADSLNAGLRYAWTPLFCCIDADTMLDRDALSRLVWEFEADPHTVATGGIVRIVNGSLVRDGQVLHVQTPKGILANLQILEYLRAFLGGRLAWSRLGMLLIISGAFGLFRRDVVVEAGGYDTSTVGEDAELVLRLHRHQRDQGKPCRITFFCDPICWTEAPTDLRVLTRQRDRWQRGLIEMIARHRGMALRPKYGAVGLVALPYFIVFELLGPVLELLGYATVVYALATGQLATDTALFFLTVAISAGFALSLLTLLMEERAFQRYPSWSCLGRLLAMTLLENLGYRQYLMVVRVRALWTQLRGGRGWGAMPRTGFGEPSASAG